MKILGKLIYGSEDSVDTDVLYVVDEMADTIEECKKFCLMHKQGNENPNIGVIEDGILVKCFKGTVDELNNAIYRTFSLHEQTTEPLITRTLERDLYLKLIRSVRSILSHFSRSNYRKDVKEALIGGWERRLATLYKISRSTDLDFVEFKDSMSKQDIMKLVAFQIGQCTALMEGKELYTKSEIADYYPELKKYLQRNEEYWFDLLYELRMFVGRLRRLHTEWFCVLENNDDNHGLTSGIGFYTDENTIHVYNLRTEKLENIRKKKYGI